MEVDSIARDMEGLEVKDQVNNYYYSSINYQEVIIQKDELDLPN